MRASWRAYGGVQGVGFRMFVLRRARADGLCGCVWNRPDGTVRVEVDGPADAVERLLQAVRTGPRGARVERVEAVAPAAGVEPLPCPFEIVGPRAGDA